MTDLQALQHYARRRDAEAFRFLVEQYQNLVYSAARRRLSHAHDVEDAVQITFCKLAKAAGSIRHDVASWLYSTALNTAAELLRNDQTRRRHESHARTATQDADSPSVVVEQQEFQTLSRLIDHALLELPADQRFLIIEHFFQNRSTRELAGTLHTSQSTVARRIKVAVDSLRTRLASRGYAAPAVTLPSALHQLTVPAPASLTGALTKVGLAGTAAAPSAVVPLSAITLGAGAKTALAAAAVLSLLTAGVLIFPSRAAPLAVIAPATATAPAAAPTDDLPPLPAELRPTDLKFTRVSVAINNLALPAAIQTFAQQTHSPLRFADSADTGNVAPVSLQLEAAPYLDALLQFTARANAHLVLRMPDATNTFFVRTPGLIAPGDPPRPGTWTASGPLAICLNNSTNDLQGNPAQVLGMQFLVEPQSSYHILVPDTLLIDTFVDDRNQPLQVGDDRRSVPTHGLPYTFPLRMPPQPGARVALLKGNAPFRLVTRTQLLQTTSPTDHVVETLAETSGTVEIFPITARVDGNTYRIESRIAFRRNAMDPDSWRLFITHFTQAKCSFVAANGDLIPATAASNFPYLQTPTVTLTFVHRNVLPPNGAPPVPQSIRLEIPVTSRRILFPFEFKDFPVPGQ